ncbi:DUF2946 family protein [Herminiimonas aquatilis]|uniref:DUF2946 family protein n=1 Tax=Herminiimonas aquatilis TaxID=345342 RepID=A0ABW2J7Z8_9BURK
MDAIVEKALAKWPNVPHCYGWLALDARGNWRMRNEQAQLANLPGEKIIHSALIAFIQRNYTHDEQDHWYFQNGPQRVYVDLEATPYIAHTELTHDAAFACVLQNGSAMRELQAAWLSDQGRVYLQAEAHIALLDDRDLAQCLNALQLDEQPVTDERLMDWLDELGADTSLSLQYAGKKISVGYIEENAIAAKFNFVRKPRPSR